MSTRILKIDLCLRKVKDDNPNFNFFVAVKIFSIIYAVTCHRNINIIKIGAVSENSENLLTDRHKNFED